MCVCVSAIFFSLSQYLPSYCTLVRLGAGSWSDRINRGSLGGLKILVVVFMWYRRWSRGWSWSGVYGGLERSPVPLAARYVVRMKTQTCKQEYGSAVWPRVP